MPAADFAPAGLRTLPTVTLSRTLFEYRYALRLLTSSAAQPLSRRMRADVTERVRSVEQHLRAAIAVVEAELEARVLEKPQGA